jgi:hypothetical protein
LKHDIRLSFHEQLARIWSTHNVLSRIDRSQRAPAGKESNWVSTSTDGGFEVLFRFYGPEKPLFDKAWKLPDIQNLN